MIEVDNVSIRYGAFALDRVSFVVPSDRYGVLMGRTGCGKTTILEAICGLRRPCTGQVRLNGEDVTQLRPAERGVGYVPQDGALFENLDVAANIGFALEIRGVGRNETKQRVEHVAEQLGIGHLLDRNVPHLSGGEKQRVALARALAFGPSVLLLDEPLSALDEDTHTELCELLGRLPELSHCTVLHVTHNHSEAARLAGCLFRFRSGTILTENLSAAE